MLCATRFQWLIAVEEHGQLKSLNWVNHLSIIRPDHQTGHGRLGPDGGMP